MNQSQVRISVQFNETSLLNYGLANVMRDCHLVHDGQVKSESGFVVGHWIRIDGDLDA